MISMENSYFRRRKLLSVTVFESEVIWRRDNAKISHLQCERISFLRYGSATSGINYTFCDQTSNQHQYWPEISKQRLTYAFFAKHILCYLYIYLYLWLYTILVKLVKGE